MSFFFFLTTSQKEHKNPFQIKQFVILFAIIAMYVWGCAYPFIKLGMIEWNIANEDVGGKMLFAGVRFAVAGLLTLVVARMWGQSLTIQGKKSIWLLVLYGLVNTALHYYLFYSGLAFCEGGKAAILNALSPVFLIILAAIIYKEALTKNKILGCVLGFIGIIIINYGTQMSGFTFQGEGMIILNCVCAAVGGIMTRVVTKEIPIITATGYGLALGGFVLVIIGYLLGGRFTRVTPIGMTLLLGLIAISMIGFILYNQLICYNEISEIAIFDALVPVFGTMMSCLMLKEAFGIQHLFGLIFTSLGIFVIHYKKKQR